LQSGPALEDSSSGTAIISDLRTTGIPLLPISPAGSDKEANARAVSPLFEAGMILLPEGAPWADDYIESMTRFPKGQHDDDVDSTSQALNYLRRRQHGVMEYIERELAKEHDKNLCANVNARQARMASARSSATTWRSCRPGRCGFVRGFARRRGVCIDLLDVMRRNGCSPRHQIRQNAMTRPHGHFLQTFCRHPSHSAVYRRFRATVRHPRAHSRRVVQGSVDRLPCRSLHSSN